MIPANERLPERHCTNERPWTQSGTGSDMSPFGDLAPDLPWYVVHTKVRQEQVAFDSLVRQGYVVYLPRIKILKRIRGRNQCRREPLFPRYLFIQVGSTTQSIGPVRSTVGVSALVRFGLEPATIQSEKLTSIREFESFRNEVSDDELSPFRPGGWIRVADGPLSGLEGLISDASHQRVVVLMQLLGQETRVSISQHQVLLIN